MRGSSGRREQGNTTAAVLGVITALISLLAAILALIPELRPWDQGGGARPSVDRTPAAIFLSRDSGPAGTDVNVSGEGFEAGERITLRFHTDQVGTTRADSAGSFSGVKVTVPETGVREFASDFIATGASSLKSARAPFRKTG